MPFTYFLKAILITIFIALSMPVMAQDTSLQAVRDISQIEADEQKLKQAVASRTLTWLTGNSANNDIISVGRLANFFGFVALRVSSGHSLSRSAIAKETLHILDERQRHVLISLLAKQKAASEEVQSARFEMNRALEGLLVSERISKEDFLALGAQYGMAEARLGQVIGTGLGEVAVSLSKEQRDKLHDIRAAYVSGNVSSGKIPGIKTNLSKTDKQELVNMAARLLSWVTGKPEHNDFEVVGKPSQHFGFVSLRLESNHGVRRGAVANEVLAILTPSQKETLDESARYNVVRFDDFLTVRGQLMRTLEVALQGQAINAVNIDKFGSAVGRLEADMTWAQASAMLAVRNSMRQDQLEALLDMRAKYTHGSDHSPDSPLAYGRQLYAQCALCHNETKDAIGRNLSQILGKKIASDDTFNNYSKALLQFASKESVWDEDLFDAFLKSPKATVPGTYMGYDGIDDETGRKALIYYLSQKDITPKN